MQVSHDAIRRSGVNGASKLPADLGRIVASSVFWNSIFLSVHLFVLLRIQPREGE